MEKKMPIGVKILITVISNIYPAMAAIYVGLWQQKVMAGLSVWFILLAMRNIAESAVRKTVMEVTDIMMTIISKATADKVVRHEVEHTVTHKERKEDWEP